MKKRLIYIAISCVLVVTSCNDLSNNLQNPNLPLITQGNLDLVLNSVQLNFQNFYWDMSNIGTTLTRQEILYGPLYKNAYNAQSYDGAWGDAYQGVLVNAQTVIALGKSQKKYQHVAIAQILQAYTLMTLVDFFGDVPYSKAFGGASNTTPTVDPGAQVYAVAMASLDSAVVNLGRTSASLPATDLYYGGSASKWVALANTLMFKNYMNLAQAPGANKASIATSIKGILASPGGVIDNSAGGGTDFQFSYGTSYTNPNSRHPKYNNNYNSSGASDFIGNWFMYVAVAEKTIINGSTVDDPRRRFYFYRQNGNTVGSIDVTALPCATQTAPAWYSSYTYWYAGSSGMPFCQLGNLGLPIATGYWGRDHGDNSGIPPDGQARTTYGVYPAGGLFDDSQYVPISGATSINLGGKGQGIAPIWLASYTEFLKAEAAMTLGVDLSVSQSSGIDAPSAFLAGVTNSVEKVVAFGPVAGVTIPAARITTLNAAAGTVGAKATYYNWVTNWFATAPAAATGTPGCKLDVSSREFYIATYGNGIEAYNLYRRTGYPSGMQFLLAHDNTDAADPYIRSAYYPAVAVNRNSAITQKSGVDAKVFWDPGLPLF
ncbi:MAG: SusD/RagB family nutrient-binding outer membrane lipoprotein [Bacteroidetes bacterium]|nr:SusD/RagB family nutrient-binding outer membrane lipoprotein [Bacteroidota bacterium]MBS1559637.1 SusD/RagB family nutrient-binding outer membrane lipoprotein [Bacteroidota bacterium]